MFEVIIDLYNKLMDKIEEKLKKILEKIKKHKKGLTRTLIGLIIIALIVSIAYIIKNKPNIIRIDNSNQSDNILVDNSKQRNKDNTGNSNGDPSENGEDGTTPSGDNPSNDNNKEDSSDKDKDNPNDKERDNSKYLNPDNISDEELDRLIKENGNDNDNGKGSNSNGNGSNGGGTNGDDSNNGNGSNGDGSNGSNGSNDPVPEGGLTPPINNGPTQGTPSADGNDYQDDPTLSIGDKKSGIDNKLTNTYYKLITNKEPVSTHIPKDEIDKMLDTAFQEKKENTSQIQSELMNYTVKGEKLFYVTDVKTAELGMYPSLTKMYYSVLGVKGNYDYVYLKLYYTKETNNYTLYYVNSTVNKDFK